MAILYAPVARGMTVLSEFSAVTGNTGAIVRRILEKLPAEAESRLCFSQDHYIFHILRSDSLTFLCMANDTLERRIPFSYLEDIEMRFMKNYGKVASHAPAYAMNDEFSRVLHQQMEFFSSNHSAVTLNRVKNEVHTIMVNSIEKILERGNRLELLVDKTATMQDSAFQFKKQSQRLHRALWMKNVKLLSSLASPFEELECELDKGQKEAEKEVKHVNSYLLEKSQPKSKQRIEGEYQEDITDALTLEKYAIRTCEGTVSRLVRLVIPPTTNFKLKGQFLNMLKETSFFGKDHEHANKHSDEVIEIADYFNIPEV
ncbi:unnamed protein product [Lactuca saligna]|uniref:Uncharacterized protein n=1 Tax=Lactuca saligna TaxID=75948 RepID=A0AA36EDJ1_LACSI|nr:unnamed protein product [Lactuca saligna]